MKIKELMPLLKVHGRTLYDEEKQALYCNWSCSGFTVKFTGKQLRIKVQASSDQIPGMPNMPTPPPDWPCVGAIVNDELIYRHECLQNEEWITLWSSEETETVEVRVIKLSENARGKLGIEEVETDGEFLKYEAPAAKTVEIIGDSITCGFGNEAPNNAFQFKTSEENGWITYGALAARELGYEFSMICESGIMAIKPEHPLWQMHAMEDIYEYTDELYDKKCGREPQKWDFEKNHSDIVVINLGTNDSNPIRFYRDFKDIEPTENWFHQRYKEFVKMIRRANGPDTLICCTLGSMDYYLYYHIRDVVREIKEETGDEKLVCF
ncbi:MAG: hypothetical protein II126_02890, partial [Erysipelotrichaceae bacterium]|nr:hypothetical protein [Erysipelotrichaceae bacterium]